MSREPGRLVLASRSPRRRELLQQINVAFEVRPVDIPEVRAAGEAPQAYVSRVARDKARAGLARVQATAGAWVLGADTEVVLDGQVFGKPVDDAEATAMLGRLAGRVHEVISCLWLVDGGHEYSASSVSRVTMAALDADRIARYVATGEARGKAGGYAIQGRAAAFISHLQGSYSGVMGLPLFETVELLRRVGLGARAAGTSTATT